MVAGCVAGRQGAVPHFWSGIADYPHGYLHQSNRIDAAAFLGPPPAAGSATMMADTALIRDTRKLEGSPRWKIAQLDAALGAPGSPRAFECALGTTFQPERAPTLTRLLARLLPDVETVQAGVKGGSDFRPRPYVAAKITTCVPGEALAKSSSYPSGHAAIGWASALILADLAPDRADALLRRGIAFGDSRVVCGFHYPSDVAAGRIVGAALYGRLRTLPKFDADMKVARRELDTLRQNAAAAPRCAVEAAALARPAW